MRTLPVNKLTADIIELGGKILVNQNGDLYYDDKLLATYEDLVGISMVSNETEMGFLNPKIGDMCKNTTTSAMYVWNGVWVPMYRHQVTVHTVSHRTDLAFVKAVAGDIANVTMDNLTSIYVGDGIWNDILTGLTGTIDDNIISNYNTWSSAKITDSIEEKINTHDHDGGIY